MANSLTADGQDLDAYAQWIGVNSNRWSVPGAKGENVAVPARHGSLFVADKTFTESEFELEILVAGVDDSGRTPVDELAQVRANIDRLLRIFTKRKKLIYLTTTLDNGDEIECYAECTGAFDVTRTSAAIPFARFTVSLTIPRAFWQDATPRTWESPRGLVSNQSLRMEPFEFGTAPMDDLVYLVHGPISEPELKVVETGAYTRYRGTLSEGEVWRVDTSTWSSTVGPADEVNLFQPGQSVIGQTIHGGSASLVDIPPLGEYDLAIELGGVNTGASTRVEARGRRKHIIG